MAEAAQAEPTAEPKSEPRVINSGETVNFFNEITDVVTELPNQDDSDKQQAVSHLRHVSNKEGSTPNGEAQSGAPKQEQSASSGESEPKADGENVGQTGEKEGERKDDKSDEPAASETENLKFLQAKDGESDVEIKENLTFTIPASGGEETVTMRELVDNYAGKTHWTKKYNELATERRSFKQQKTQIDNRINHLFELSKSDPRLAYGQLAEVLGGSAQEAIQNLETHMTTYLEKMSSMTPEERKLHEVHMQLEHQKSLNTYQKEQQDTERVNIQVQQQMQQLQSEFNIDDNAFNEKFEHLENLQKTGELKVEDITPAYVATAIRQERADTSALNILKSIDPKLSLDHDKVITLGDLAFQNPNWTEAELKEIAITAFKQDVSESISDKVRKTGQTVAQQKPSEDIQPMHQALTFDDVMFNE